MGGGNSTPSISKEDSVLSRGDSSISSSRSHRDRSNNQDSHENEDADSGADEVVDDESVTLDENSYTALSKRVDLNNVRLLKKNYNQQDVIQAPSQEMNALAMLEMGMALRENKTITSIDLPHQYIPKNGLLFLLQELYENGTLKTLDLSYNMMGSAEITDDHPSDDDSMACIALGKLLNSDVTVIESINLEMTNLSPADGVEIGEALAKNKSLQTLRLSSNAIGNAGSRAIWSSLSSTTTLLLLELNSNNIGPESISVLAGALRSPAAVLKTLYLERNNLGAEGCKYLSSGLLENMSLKTIRYLQKT